MNNSLIIFNTKNYNKNIDEKNILSFMKVYIQLLKEYLDFLLNNIDIKEINEHFLFIAKRGLITYKHIFNILFLYTKNFTLILHHIKKAYLYYVEFIGQIGHDNHAYLKLNSRDASLFVYKKTIYEINNDFKKDFVLTEEEKKKHFKLTKTIDIINTLILIILKNVKLNNEKLTYKKIKSDIEKIEKGFLKAINNYDKFNLDILSILLDKTELLKIGSPKVLELVNSVINKFLNKAYSETKVKEKLNSYKNNEKINKLTSIKYINWLFK
tara:strand:+ start:5033 stop:5839 length:807 start_codon:yes stop_codon:yes gene_type:complete